MANVSTSSHNTIHLEQGFMTHLLELDNDMKLHIIQELSASMLGSLYISKKNNSKTKVKSHWYDNIKIPQNIQNFSLKGGTEVSPDDNGTFALVDSKYVL